MGKNLISLFSIKHMMGAEEVCRKSSKQKVHRVLAVWSLNLNMNFVCLPTPNEQAFHFHFCI